MMKKSQILVLGLVASLWVVVSPWVLGFADLDVALWSNVFAGAILGLVFLWVLFWEE